MKVEKTTTEFKQNGSYIVSWDFSRGNDIGVLIVGRQEKGKVTVINAFQGEEAHDIFKKLTGDKNAK